MSNFDESKVKRDSDGKFAVKEGGDTPAEVKRAEELTGVQIESKKDIPSSKGKNKTEADFFGVEHKGVKGTEAIERLLIDKAGHVKNAFSRPEIGEMDIVWGDKSGGLDHLIKQRDKDLINGNGTITGVEMARKIPSIVDNGDFYIGKNDRPEFNYDGFRVSIKPTFDGKKLNWIISAMEIKKLEDS